MKTYLLPIALLSMFLVSCGSKNYMHNAAKDVRWEMTPDELMETHELEFQHDAGFRQVYMEHNPHPDIPFIVYYFDIEEGREPLLYETITGFNSEQERDVFATKTLGAPNTPEGEWEWTTEEGLFKAWTFKERLVVVKVIPGCEWDE